MGLNLRKSGDKTKSFKTESKSCQTGIDFELILLHFCSVQTFAGESFRVRK